jgi:hypothetical protein
MSSIKNDIRGGYHESLDSHRIASPVLFRQCNIDRILDVPDQTHILAAPARDSMGC